MKTRLTIVGDKVHEIGYRLFLTIKASEAGLEGFSAFNIEIGGLQAVVCYAEGEEGQLENFLKLVETERPPLAKVKSVRVDDYEGPVMDIMKYIHILQLEQMGKFVSVGIDISGKQGVMLEKQDQMLEKQDRMLEKQDQMLGKMDLMLEKQDKTLYKMDLMLKKQDDLIEGQREMVKEIKDLRADLKSYMDERFRKIEADIAKIKERIGLT